MVIDTIQCHNRFSYFEKNVKESVMRLEQYRLKMIYKYILREINGRT